MLDDFLQEVIEQLHDLLLKLNVLSRGMHPCLLQYLHKKFQGSHRVSSFTIYHENISLICR